MHKFAAIFAQGWDSPAIMEALLEKVYGIDSELTLVKDFGKKYLDHYSLGILIRGHPESIQKLCALGCSWEYHDKRLIGSSITVHPSVMDYPDDLYGETTDCIMDLVAKDHNGLLANVLPHIISAFAIVDHTGKLKGTFYEGRFALHCIKRYASPEDQKSHLQQVIKEVDSRIRTTLGSMAVSLDWTT